MRVLHVLPSIAPRYGGPSTAILPMCEALHAIPGLEVEVACTDADGPGHLDPRTLPPGRTLIRLFRKTCSERWKVSLELWRWLARHARDYDLLHVHALWTFSTFAACAAAHRGRIPVVIRPCGMLSPYTWSRSSWQKSLYWGLLERRNLASARAFHVTSLSEAAEVQRLRAHLPGPTFVIPQGTDPNAFQQPARPALLRQRCGPGAGDRPLLLFLSRLHPKKGVTDQLLPAFARLRTPAFLAIAGGPDEHAPGYEREVRATVERLGLADRVALLGPVAAPDRWALFDGADLFVLPSHSENFGIVVTEAMARGLPVVVSEGVQAAEHVRVADAGRVVPLEPAALASALDELLADAPLRRLLGQRGSTYARTQLTWERVATSLAEMYRACLPAGEVRSVRERE